jgi:methyl-accepting chemotaxis protein
MRAMRMGLQTLIQQIRDSAEQLAALSTSISSLSNQDMNIVASGQSTEEKLASIITQMGMSAEEIASNMDVLSASVEETSASVAEMANSISSIASNATKLEQQTEVTIEALAMATSTLEGVTEKAGVSHTLSEETIQDALEGQEAVEQVTASMDTIQQTNSSAVEAITRFARQTGDIDTILDVINEITDQSALLALNASIIAAQAGTHGRGFAVIADEMRNLATKVNASTKDIAAIVQTVQKETGTVVKEIHKGTADIEQGVQRTQQARKMLEKITTSAQRSSNVVTEIVDALRTMQKTTGDDMKVAMERVHTMTASITRATNEQKSSTLQINKAVDHIRDMALQTQNSTTQQLEGVQQILEAVNNVRTLTDQNVQSSQLIEQASGDLNEQAQLLMHSVDRFKLLSNEALAQRRKTEAIRQADNTEVAVIE